MNTKLLILFLFFIASFSHAQNEDSTISLNGEWEIIFDHKDEGRSLKWYYDYNFENHSDKKPIMVPSCWEELEQDYEGVAFYRKKFIIPKEWNDKIITLNFDAVNYVAEVWLNNKVIDYHEGGFTPFSFRIDKSAKIGEENVLTVRVVGPIILTNKYIDNMGSQETPQWRGGIVGGIWQSVSISATDSFKIKDVFIETDIHKKTASFAYNFESNAIKSDDADVSLIITSPEGKKVAEKKATLTLKPGNNTGNWKFNIPDATLWSLENPYLYKAVVQLKYKDKVSDQWEHKFGLREFTIKGDKFQLNAEPIYLKATFFEGLYPVRIAIPDTKEMAIKEILLAKEAGFNMIRPWRKPPSKMWLELCDSIGIMTVGSLVVECMDRPISSPYLAKRVEQELRESIMRDRNRTCLVQWELFNEANRPVLQQMMHSMSVLTQELDPSRLIVDESGGTKGANMYLPYQSNPIRFNDIHTYPGGQVNKEQYDKLLIIGKTKDERKALGLGHLGVPGRNVQPGMMSFLSELGYASWPNLVENNKMFQEKGNPIAPAAVSHKKLEQQVREAFKVTGLDKAFPDLEKYCFEEQRIHGIANKRMIEATRENPIVSGYCVHALTDGDWILGAALLDLWRNPKPYVYEMTKAANQKQIVSIQVVPRNIYAEKGGEISISGINELADDKVKITVGIETIKGRKISSTTFNSELKNGISQLYKEALNTQKMKGTYVVKVTVRNTSNKIITSNEQTFDVFTSKQLTIPTQKVAVLGGDSNLTSFLKTKNIEFIPFTENLNLTIPVIVGKEVKGNTHFSKQVEAVKEFAKSGGYVIFLEITGPSLTWGAPNPQKKPKNNYEDWHRSIPRVLTAMPISKLPFNADMYATNGNYISRNHIVTDNDIFKGLPVNTLMSGVYENICPTKSICLPAKGKYLAGVITYDQNKNMDIMLRHYNGIGDVLTAADVLLVEHGKGKMLFSTMRILENLEKDPVADKLLYNIINLNN